MNLGMSKIMQACFLHAKIDQPYLTIKLQAIVLVIVSLIN